MKDVRRCALGGGGVQGRGGGWRRRQSAVSGGRYYGVNVLLLCDERHQGR